MRKGVPGQVSKTDGHSKSSGVPKGQGVPRSKGVPKGSGRPKGDGVPKGEGVAKADGILPGADGQRVKGTAGQVDRGTPGQMDPWAPNPWAVGDEFEDFPESPDEEFAEGEFTAHHPNLQGAGDLEEGD